VIKSIRKNLPLHLMMLPSVIILLVFSYIPMFGIIIAFQHYMPYLGFSKSDFVGLDNFYTLFTTPGFVQALFNTVYISFWKMVTGIIVPVTFALLLNEVNISAFKRSVQTIIYLPYFISWVLMAGIIIDILSPTNGIVNQLLNLFGIKSILFLGDNNWFPAVIISTNVWKEFGWGTIIYMAALSGIDPTLYEASVMDGAGRWKQTLHITLPGIVPTIILLSVLSLGNILNAGFDQIYNLMSPVTMQSGDIIDTLVYRLGINNGQFSVATAAGLFKSAISCLFIVVSYKLAYRFAGYKIF
jgi:putative aldouronate transport system permease protein